jgi:hypothetical protein
MPQVKILSAESKPLRKQPRDMRVMPEKCETCPYREGSSYAYLRHDLSKSALSNASRVCHNTGSNNGVHRRTGKPAALCRGARDLQLAFFTGIGFLEAATDEAWDKKLKEIDGETNQGCKT